MPGMNTRNRPGKLMCRDSRGPLLPMGSFTTCTRISSPSRTGGSGARAAPGTPGRRPPRPPPRRASSLGRRWASGSSRYRNPSLAPPMATKALCMPCRSLATLPLYTSPTWLAWVVRSMNNSHSCPFSSRAMRVSSGVALTTRDRRTSMAVTSRKTRPERRRAVPLAPPAVPDRERTLFNKSKELMEGELAGWTLKPGRVRGSVPGRASAATRLRSSTNTTWGRRPAASSSVIQP